MSGTKGLPTTAPSEAPSDRRRSHRVHIAMPVVVRGKNGTQPFEEQTSTMAVSAHGCLLRVSAQLTRGQQISLVNPKTAEELPCTVIFLGTKEGGKTEVGVEFVEPSPVFWRISFPPEDWDPSERKRPTTGVRPPATPSPTTRK